ncbi:MAG: hypothetical protein D6795_05845 [Deltaproteobacteria bacterium]|nr:MAG: hypothetical protein D6795_05845 [Deltaproteobacteria bacterium]
MEIARLTIGIPILELEVLVHHSTPRPMTAFERILFKLHERFRTDPEYGVMPLSTIFERFLSVPDPQPVVHPILEELHRLEAIRIDRSRQTSDEYTLNAFEITDRGRTMMERNELPAVHRQDTASFLYDPIRKTLLLKRRSSPKKSDPSPIHIEADPFREVFPEETIREQIPKEGFPWWKEKSRIDHLERRNVEILWRDLPASLHLLPSGELQVVCEEKETMEYLAKLPPETLEQRIVRPIFDPPEGFRPVSLRIIDTRDLLEKEAGSWRPLSQCAQYAQAKILLVQGDGGNLTPPKASAGQVIFQFQRGFSNRIEWNDHRDGAIVSLTGVPFPREFDGALLASQEHLVSAYLWERSARQHRQTRSSFPIAHCVEIEKGSETFDTVLEQLAQSLRTTTLRMNDDWMFSGGSPSPDPVDFLLLPAFWEPAERFWEATSRTLGTSRIADVGRTPATSRSYRASHPLIQKIVKRLECLLRIREGIRRIEKKTALEGWRACVVKVVQEGCALSQREWYSPPPPKDLELCLDLLTSCDLKNEEKGAIANDLLEVFRERSQSIFSSVSSFDRFSEIVGILQKAQWPIPFPSALYENDRVIREIANRFPDPSLEGIVKGENDFHQSLRVLLECYRQIEILVGREVFEKAPEHDTLLPLLKTKQGKRLVPLAEKWQGAFSTFRDSLEALVQHLSSHGKTAFSLSPLEDSKLFHIDAMISAFLEGWKKLAEPDPRFRETYIFDTSALLSKPDLLDKIPPDASIVVSKRVIEELDDKKGEERLRRHVTQVTNALQAFPADRIEFAEGDLSLLSPDYRKKGDNLILSVAVRYQRCHPMLVTDDKNLTLKAKAEGIETISSDHFLQSLESRAKGKRTKKKKKKKGKGS